MPSSIEEFFATAVDAHRDGKLEDAEQIYRQILGQQPGHAASLSNLGRIAKARGNAQEALELYGQAASRDDAAPEVLFNLGLTWLELDNPQKAQLWLHKAVVRKPKDAQLWHTLGKAAERAGDAVTAVGAYRQTIGLAGKLGEAGVRLAKLFWETGKRSEALDLLRGLVAENPESADSVANLGYAALTSHRYVEALGCYKRAVALSPEYPDGEERVAKCLLNLGQLDEALEIFRRLAEDPSRRQSAGQGYLMSLLYSPDLAPRNVLAEHRRVTKSWSKGIRRLKLTRKERSDVLRVGYLTPDLQGTHPVAQFVEPLLRAHKGDETSSFVYSNTQPATDVDSPLSDLATVMAVDEMDDQTLAQAIADDGLDLLVDLSGHTHGTRLPVMSYRPAPVQATFVGYPHSTGFKPVDYLIADPVVVPPAAERACSEHVARLRHAFLCFVPPSDMPTPRPHKPGSKIVFGSLNHLPKISEPTVKLWSAVLDAVPDSCLLMKCAAFGEAEACDLYRRRFQDHGISADRLVLEGPSPFADAMRAYNRIDIALDTAPYNGGTTTCHALWMAVPVVSLKGENFCGRMGASFLGAAGFPEFVADDDKGFIAVATRLASDRTALGDLKAGMLQQVPASPLCDIDAYASDVLALYREISRT